MTTESFYLEETKLKKNKRNISYKISFNFVLLSSILILSMIVVMLTVLLLLR